MTDKKPVTSLGEVLEEGETLGEVVDVRSQQISWEELVERENKTRGFDVTVLDKDKLLKRIKAKDWSAYFLGKTFCTMYRTGVKAELDFTNVCNLDSEGKNFLFKIIFARDVPNWSCDFLYSIEQEIKEILDLVVDENGLIVKNRNYSAYKFKISYETSKDLNDIHSYFDCTISTGENSDTISFKDGSVAIVYHDDDEVYVRTRPDK